MLISSWQAPRKIVERLWAASSFLSFVGVLLAALSLGLFSSVLNLTAAEGYLVIGLLSLLVSIIITFFFTSSMSREFLRSPFFKSFYHIDA